MFGNLNANWLVRSQFRLKLLILHPQQTQKGLLRIGGCPLSDQLPILVFS